MPSLADVVRNAPRRLSLPFIKSSSKETETVPAETITPLDIDCSIESPPAIFHGSTEDSSGALVSGQLFLHVKADAVDISSFIASLSIYITQKYPFHGNCSECALQKMEIKTWKFLVSPRTLLVGRHPFPFSMLLEGHLPASLDTTVMSVTYELEADACLETNDLTVVNFRRSIEVMRSLVASPYAYQSIRVFPPTNIKVTA